MDYIYVLKFNPDYYDEDVWTDEVNQIIDAHFQRLKSDYEKGKVIHVGRTENPKDEGFGLVIYHADDDQDAKHYMENDPAIKNKIMTGTYQRYKVVFNHG
ncbi:hypothetical protein BK010_04520 [Tenericutes bacterium MO-XQ]|nr:hypothetical protein BK010_04520 [Tenericutes bacterium MO-XQ]